MSAMISLGVIPAMRMRNWLSSLDGYSEIATFVKQSSTPFPGTSTGVISCVPPEPQGHRLSLSVE